MGVTVDTSDLRSLAAVLDQAPATVERGLRGAVVKGAVAIKNQLRREMQASEYFKGAARSIDFDVREGTFFGVKLVEAEIGPRTGSGEPGALANIAYFGGARGGGGTVPDPQKALDAEAPRFEAAIAGLLDGAL